MVVFSLLGTVSYQGKSHMLHSYMEPSSHMKPCLCCFCYLRKTTRMYYRCLKAFRKITESRWPNLLNQVVMKSDMELAIVNAGLQMGLTPSICFFHYVQAISRWLDNKSSTWNELLTKSEVHNYCYRLFQAADPSTFESIKNEFREKLGEDSAFWFYYERQFLSNHFYKWWCKAWTPNNDFFLDDTNNGAEARNNVFRTTILKRFGSNEKISLTAALTAMYDDALANFNELERVVRNRGPSKDKVPHGRTELTKRTEQIIAQNEKERYQFHIGLRGYVVLVYMVL